MLNNRRLLNFAGFGACVALLAYAIYVQFALGIEPCPLCIFQRLAIASLGVVFLVAAIHHPRDWGSRVYAVLLATAALVAMGIAGRHVYIQHFPPEFPSCGAPLAMMIKHQAPFDVIKKVLTGDGECSEVNWSFLGLAMPAWVLICALVLGAFGVVANAGRRRQNTLRQQVFQRT